MEATPQVNGRFPMQQILWGKIRTAVSFQKLSARLRTVALLSK